MTSYYQADGLGSVTSLSNGTGALAQTYTFDSFGKQTASSGSLIDPFQYTGREFDTETGLYYYRARYYDSSAGRFVSEDPLEFAGGGANFYAYATNDPTSLADPFGWSPRGRDKWYGYNDDDFRKWVHRCWKNEGDRDLDKGEIIDAYNEWVRRGSPKNGRCWNGPEPEPCTQPEWNPSPIPVVGPILDKIADPILDWLRDRQREFRHWDPRPGPIGVPGSVPIYGPIPVFP